MTDAQFLEFFISVSIQAALIVCLTSWLCKIVQTPRLQCHLWNTCHLLLLMVTVSGMLLPHFRPLAPWQQLSPRIVEQVVVAETMLGRSLLGVWIVGMLLSTFLLIFEWRQAFRFLKSCRVANEQERRFIAADEEHSCLHISNRKKSPVQLLISHQLGSPFCCQWHRPHLVIPEFLLEFPPEEIKLVARHEWEHLHSGHPLQLFIERLVVTAFWFHPAIWWAAKQSSLAREYACDDAAVLEQKELVSYLRILLAIAERGLSEEKDGATLFFGRGANVIALRARRLLNRSRPLLTPPSDQWRISPLLLVVLSVATWFIWIPLDALASSRSKWSPWPQWSACILRTFEIPARDFEPYEIRTRLYELSIQSSQKKRTDHPMID